MKANGIRRSTAQWQEIIRQYAISPLSVTTFCDEQGISVSSLYYWRKKLGRQVDSDEIRVTAGTGFIELGDARQSFGSWDIELELGGMVLRVRQD